MNVEAPLPLRLEPQAWLPELRAWQPLGPAVLRPAALPRAEAPTVVLPAASGFPIPLYSWNLLLNSDFL